MPLHVQEFGEGEPLLLMPGFTESVSDMLTVPSELAQQYHVIGVDLPGSGGSTPIPRAFTKAFYEEDVRTIGALLDERGIRSTRVAGFSDGGEVGLLLAARRPELVRALVSWGACGVIGPWVGHWLSDLERVIDSPSEGMKKWSEHLVGRYGRDDARETMRSWTAAIRDILEAGGDISFASAARISCPVLLITGELDRGNPPEAVRSLGQRLRSAEVVVVQGAGHSVHRDKAAWFLPTITSWLAAH
jgi:valacyclovir hydrolase